MTEFFFTCELCNYQTDDSSNYKRHIRSKRHCKNLQAQPANQQDLPAKMQAQPAKNDYGLKKPNKYKCSHCNMMYTRKYNLNQHIEKCIHKKVKDEQNLNKKLQQEILDLREEKQRLIIQYQEEIAELREENKYINRTVLKIAEKQAIAPKKQINNTQYIITNFPDAPNLKFPEIEWSDDIINKYVKMGTVQGISKIITDCWVHNVKPEDRSIWNVDYARNKYLIRIGDAWMVDVDGTKFQEITIDKIYDIFMNYMKTCKRDPSDMLEIMQFICDIKSKNMAMKVMKEAGKYLIYDNEKYKDEDLEKFEGI